MAEDLSAEKIAKQEQIDNRHIYMKEFGARLRFLRKLRKKRIDAIAQHIKLHRSTYNSYELGYRLPDLPTLKELATFLETSTDYLLFKNDDPEAAEAENDIKDILQSGNFTYGGESLSEEQRVYLSNVVDSIIGNLDTLDLIIKNKSSK